MKNLLFIAALLLAIPVFGQTGRFTNVIATNQITSGALTSTRVTFATTGGLLSGSANMTFNPATSLFTVNGISFDSSGNVTGVNTLAVTTLSFTSITGTVGVANGGTGVATLTAYAPIFGGTTGTGAVQSGTAGTQGQVLVSNGAGVLPAFEALDLADTDAVTGVLPAAKQGGIIEIAGFSVDGGGSVITSGTVSGTKRIPFACTLTGYSITATANNATLTVTFWAKASATTIPTIANVISTSGVVLANTDTATSGGTSDFTDTVFAAGDMMRCAFTVSGTATDLTVTLYGTRL